MLRKALKKIKTVSKEVSVAAASCDFSSGVSTSGGEIRQGKGLCEKVCLDGAAAAAWEMANGNVVFQYTDGQPAVYDGQSANAVWEAVMGSCVAARYDRDGDSFLVVSDGTEAFCYDGDGACQIPPFTSATVFADRVFTVCGDKRLRFSAPFDPASWREEEGGGWIDFQHDCLAVCTMGKFVYVFCQGDVVRVSAGYDDGAFSARSVKVAPPSGFLPQTLRAYGGKAMLVANGNLMAFDGIKYVVLGKMDGDLTSAVASSGKNYCVAFCDEVGTLAVYDGKDLSFLSGVANVCDGDLIVAQGGRVASLCDDGCFFGVSTTKTWSKKTDFGTYAKKKVVGVLLETDSPLTVTVEAESQSQVKRVCGGEEAVFVPFCVVGRAFRLTLSTQSTQMRVKNVRLLYQVFKGE